MEGPFLCYKEVLPASSLVTGCYFRCFDDLSECYEEFLCTFSPNLINIFSTTDSLKLLKSDHIYGTPKSVKAYHRGDNKSDILVVAFDESKLVFAEYTPVKNCLMELNILNVNDNSFIKEDKFCSKSQYLGNGINTVIKASSVYKSFISLFYGEIILFGDLSKMSKTSDAKFEMNHFLFCPSKQINLIGPILDITFLAGYSKPTIAILQQENLLPIGHAAKVLHTCSLTVLAIDPGCQSVAVLWTQRNLPHDSKQFVDLGVNLLHEGIVVVCKNSILIVHQCAIQGLATNSFASVTVSSNIALRPWTSDDNGYELDSSKWNDVSLPHSPTSLVGFLKNGSILLIHLFLSVKNFPTSLSIQASKIGNCGRTSFCVVSCNSTTLFAGAHHGVCFLYQLKRIMHSVSDLVLDCSETSIIHPKKKKKLFHCLESNYCKEVALCATSPQANKEICWSLQLLPLDSFDVLGPLLHSFFTKRDDIFSQTSSIEWERNSDSQIFQKSISTAASYIAERESKDSFCIGAGLDEDSAIHKLFSGVALGKIGTRNFPGATRFHTVCAGSQTLMIVSYENRSRIFLSHNDYAKAARKSLSELKFSELSPDDCGFFGGFSTLLLNKIWGNSASDPNYTVVVQINSVGIRLIKILSSSKVSFEVLQDIAVRDKEECGGMGGVDDEFIVTADVCEGYLVVLTNLSTVLTYKFDSLKGCLKLVLRKPFFESNCYVSFIDREYCLKLFSSRIISVSLYYGEFSMLTKSLCSDSKVQLQEVAEQEFSHLYKQEVCTEHGQEPINVDSSVSESCYLITSEANGYISIINIENGECMFRSRHFCLQSDFILLEAQDSSIREEVDVLSTKYQYIVETKFTCLRYAGTNALSTVKVLTLLFQSGELVVYTAYEKQNKILSFNRIITKTIHNKRFPTSTVSFKNTAIFSEMEISGQNFQSNSFFDSEDFLHRIPQTIFEMENPESGCDCLLVSANDPIIISIEKGYPIAMSLGFPELPHINCGHYTVLPFFTAGKTLIGSMWIEFDDIESFKHHIHMRNRAQKQSTLGLYYILPKQTVLLAPPICGGGVSMQKVAAKKTVHKCLELHNLTDKKTEQALLDKKTFVLFTSSSSLVKLNKNVVGPEDNETEDVLFERYFPIVESFEQPDDSIAPSPCQMERSFQISLMQNGNVVDSYSIPTKENVMDVIAAYFTVDKSPNHMSNAVNMFGPAPSKVLEKRVFVLVSTLEKDKRGEDSQGNGRLLLLGLDYALFDNDVGADLTTTSSNDTEVDTQKNNRDEITMNETVGSVNHSDFMNSVDENFFGKSSLHSAQQKFLGAIQPKLKVLWEGSGPGSKLQQMPAKTTSKNGESWSNYVVTTVGSTLYIYKFNSVTFEMDQVAFFFAQVLILLLLFFLFVDFVIFSLMV